MPDAKGVCAWEPLEGLEPRMVLAAVFWDGGGGDLSWHNPLNWSADVLPGAGDDVTIALEPGLMIQFDQAEMATIRSLVGMGGAGTGLSLSAGSLTVTQNWNSTGDLVIDGGLLVANGEWRQRGGVMIAAGGLVSDASAVHVGPLSITGGNFVAAGTVWRNGPLEIAGGMVTISGVWAQNGPTSFSGGTIRGGTLGPSLDRVLALVGETHWTGGTIEGVSMQVRPGTRLLIEGDVAMTGGAVLVNRGLVTWRSGNFSVVESTIWNLEGHRFNMQSPGFLGGEQGGTSWLLNLGEVWRNGTANTTTTLHIGLDNQGAVDVRRGGLDLRGPIDQLVPINWNPSAMLRGGTWRVSSSHSRLDMPLDISRLGGMQTTFPGPSFHTVVELHGAGAAFPRLEKIHSVENATLRLSGGRQFTFTSLPYQTIPPHMGAPLFVNSGTIVLANPGTTTLPARRYGGAWEIQQGTARFPGNFVGGLVIAEGAQVILAGDQNELNDVSGAGLLRLQGRALWERGRISGGALIIEEGARLDVRGRLAFREPPFDKFLSRRTLNYGTIEWADYEGQSFVGNTIANHGIFILRGSLGSSFTNPATSHLVNFGTLQAVGTLRGREQGGGGMMLINVGHVRVEGDFLNRTLTLSGGVRGGGTWVLPAGSELRLAGEPGAMNGAVIDGRGLLRIAGPLTWLESARMGGPIAVAPTGRPTFFGEVVLTPTGFVNNGRMTLAPGAQVTIAPTVGGFDHLRDLRLEPGSLLRIAGAGYFGPQATTTTVLAGTAAEQFGRIEATRPRRFDPFIIGGGSLFAEFAPGFDPGPGVTFDFLSADGRQGTFNMVAAENAPPGRGIVLNFVGGMGRLVTT
jgi:hypothetical protein